MSRHGPVEAADQDAGVPGVAVARSALWLGAISMCGAILLAAGLAGVGIAGWVLLPGAPIYGVLMLVVVGVTVAWSVLRVARTPVSDPAVVMLSVSDAAELHRAVAEVAGGLGVAPPGMIAVTPGTRPRLLDRGGTLAIPACWLWWLTVRELRQALAEHLALIPAIAQRDIADAHRLVLRLEAAQLQHYRHPLVGRPLRALHGAISRRAAALDQLLAAWAGRRAAAVAGDDADAVRWQADFAAEAWSALIDRFAVPAWISGAAPRGLGEGTRGFAMAHVHAGLVEGLAPQHRENPAAVSMLRDARSVDERVSMLAQEQLGGEPRRPFAWSDYVSEVVDPERRRRAGALVSAVDRVEGRTGPASVSRVLDCLQAGGYVAVAADLTDQNPDETPQDHGERMVVALREHLSALVGCALVDGGVATDHFDWIRGHCLIHHEYVLDLSDPLQVASSSPDASALRSTLAELGLDTALPVWIADQQKEPVRMRWAMAGVAYRRKLYDVVVCDDRLLLLVAAKGVDLTTGLDRLSGSTAGHHRRLLAILGGRVDELVAKSPDNQSLLIRDVVDARIRAGRLFATWTCIIRLTDHRVVLRNASGGRGSPRMLVNQLAPLLGDRLTAPARLRGGE